MGVKYLSGKGLAKRIRKVMAEENPWMCVAFLGPTWTKELFDGGVPPENLRIVCDLRMGMTVQKALRGGGAPDNERLRHLPRYQMHAKIYASDSGAVVCSANASCAALSSVDRVEDGVWLPPGSKPYRKAKETFEMRYSEAVRVDADALARAPERLGDLGNAAVGTKETVDLGNPPTLLQLLRYNPEAFKGIRFVFSNSNVSKLVREGAKAVMDEEVARDAGTVVGGGDSPPAYDYFADWDKEEADWPALFISVHRNQNEGIVLGMRRHLRFIPEVPDGNGEPEDVFVAAKVRWNIGGAAFCDLRELATVKECAIELKDFFQRGRAFDHVVGKVLAAGDVCKALKLT